ncbi:hypothetical protein [Arenicella chitinivorans]|nr:hypothetical protein [Arenicella chitinivorans]
MDTMTTNDPDQQTTDLLDALRTQPSNQATAPKNSKLARRLSYQQYRKAIWLTLVLVTVAIIVKPLVSPLIDAALNAQNGIIIGVLLIFFVAIISILVSETDTTD